MNKRFLLLFALITILSVNNTFSQGCEGDEPVASASGEVDPYKPILFGYLQSQYDYNFDGLDENENSFKFKRARIGVRGKVDEKFSYYFMLEASPFIGGDDQEEVYLMDAFVTYNADNWARISAGTYKQPFGLELVTPCHMLTTIERSVVIDQLVAPQRDFGLAVFGGNKYNKFNYAVALMNGRGLKFKDNNSKKDIIARATYKLTNFLTVGGNFRHGYPKLNNNEDSRTTYGGEFLVEFDKFKVQGEYIHDTGAYQAGTGGGCGIEPIDLDGLTSEGAYIMASYDVNEKFQPVFKYEYFDPDVDVKNNLEYLERMTLGINYFFSKKVRLQLNYLANIETVVNVDNDALLGQIQVKF
ncbi:porin [Seonamhaeicola maritimus]|uniref:porin n=1 Tax=Seonamhaeicola maritimus TaxID=2591822 RepID=UPI0024942154|nr:porin [Seonamhaeicola maritimus]